MKGISLFLASIQDNRKRFRVLPSVEQLFSEWRLKSMLFYALFYSIEGELLDLCKNLLEGQMFVDHFSQ